MGVNEVKSFSSSVGEAVIAIVMLVINCAAGPSSVVEITTYSQQSQSRAKSRGSLIIKVNSVTGKCT